LRGDFFNLLNGMKTSEPLSLAVAVFALVSLVVMVLIPAASEKPGSAVS
jgi:hypothetical protein